MLAAALAAPFAFTFSASAGEADTPQVEAPGEAEIALLVDHLIKQVETESIDRMWDPVTRLVRLARANGDVVTDRLERQLTAHDPKMQLAAARALCQLNNTDHAAPLLAKLMKTGQTPEMRRYAATALGLTNSLNGNEGIVTSLKQALEKELDGPTRIAIGRSLWYLGTGSEGRDVLISILNETSDRAVKDEAALVLAENGSIQLQDVRQRLLNLYSEPTPQGERARSILRNAEDEALRTRESKLAKGQQLLRELVQVVKTAYPDESKTELDELFQNAAKGMISSLDPFSQYLDRDDVKATQEMLSQDYGGIGAYVGWRNSNFVVTAPIYGSPADRAGLRALDIIQEVDGNKATEIADRGGVNGVIAKLKGKPGTPVRVKYFRRGFGKPIEVTILREQIRVDTVVSAMLPGQIAYIRLTRFGERSAEEVQKAMDHLLKEQKAKALVFDLRDNPGGLLRSGVEISDKFLAGGKLLVYSEGNKEIAPRRDYFSTGNAEEEAYPMTVLVGPGSASASEIVAGALQDHKRAVLVGEKTYGKGSVQQIMPLNATDRETQVRLTIAKYYLPSGRCIHEKGVEVDIEAKATDQPGWVIETLMELRRTAAFEDYVRRTWAGNEALYKKLAENDGNKCDEYPEFQKFYDGLKTRVDANVVRIEVRGIVRRMVADDRKQELGYDLQEDTVLQRGVLEALRKMRVDPTTIAEYKDLPEKFAAQNPGAQQGAMLPDADATRTP